MLADLIPPTFFSDIGPDWVLWLLTAGAIAALVFGADKAVAAAVNLATALGMSKIIIGATVVSLGTTAPEAFTSVTAAFQNRPGLALGNGVGSIICNAALIFGLGCWLGRLPKDRFVLRRHGWLHLGAGVLLAATVAALAIVTGGVAGVKIPRGVGVFFLALLGLYMYMSVRWARKHPTALPAELQTPEQEIKELAAAPPKRARMALANLGLLMVGLALVVLGSNVVIGSVSELALRYRVPPNVLAVTLVAFGTSLPELVTAMTAIAKGHPELLVGNIIGANILNVLFVVGASATAVPLGVPGEFYWLHLPVMLVAMSLLRVFMSMRKETFQRWQGTLLLALFLTYYGVLVVLMLTGRLAVVEGVQ